MTAAASLERALALLRSGDLAGAETHCRSALRADPSSATARFQLGRLLQARGQTIDAVEAYRQALDVAPQSPELYVGLGTALCELREVDGAIACFQMALAINPGFTPAFFHLGNLCIAQARYEEAVGFFERVLADNPQLADAHCNMGTALMFLDRVDEAVESFRHAAECAPDDARALGNLGHACRRLGRIDEAVTALERSTQLAPNSAAVWYSLARGYEQIGRLDDARNAYRRCTALTPDDAKVLHRLGNVAKELAGFDEAADYYRRASRVDPAFAAAWYELGNTCKHQGKLDEAVACYQKVLDLVPDDPGALVCLGNVLKSQEQLVDAAGCYRRLLKNRPDQPVWDLWIAGLCPAVFPDAAAIDAYRAQLAAEIARIDAVGLRIDAPEISNVGCPAPYNLQFHGRDDRPLKEAYARVFRQCIPRFDPPANRGRARIGFVVTGGHEGVFLRFMKGVLERIDRSQFDLAIVGSQQTQDKIISKFNTGVVQPVVIPHRFDKTIEIVRDARFDVLYYWEVGSDIVNYFLPFVRLAAVQCTSGGLPVTSGIPGLDYFLTNDLAEIVGADAHYSERLIHARTHLSYQQRIRIGDRPKSRSEFGIAEKAHLYVCAQKIQKFHPDFDAILAEVLCRDPAGVIAIPEDQYGHMAQQLRARFVRTMPDVADRIHWLPRLALDDYLALLAAADVLLDPLHYGGGLTAYDAFSFDRPVVTLPTEFVRGRYTYAFYRRMGVSRCVATSAGQYVEIAVRLGCDRDFHAEATREIRATSRMLFEDRQAVDDYNEIFARLVDEARSPGRRIE